MRSRPASKPPWGLTIDDLTFASPYGTSTKAKNINELRVEDVIDGIEKDLVQGVVALPHKEEERSGHINSWIIHPSLLAVSMESHGGGIYRYCRRASHAGVLLVKLIRV